MVSLLSLWTPENPLDGKARLSTSPAMTLRTLQPYPAPEGSALELLVHDEVETRALMTVLTPNISAHSYSRQ